MILTFEFMLILVVILGYLSTIFSDGAVGLLIDMLDDSFELPDGS